MSDYVLGTGDDELARLRLQQEVWGPITEHFLDRLRLDFGARVLDLGCGPGLVLDSLHSRVGGRGHITALDESPAWMARIAHHAAERGWTNLHLVQKRLQDADLGVARYDLIFARWVFSFLPDVGALVKRLARALAPGGRLAIEDYNHEGVSLFPESAGFRAVIRATRELYASKGGDTWIAARLPGHLRAAGLELVEYTPHVLCGGPGSPAFRWADAFFPHHSAGMVAAGVLSCAERELFLSEWEERKRDPDAVFFSPIVMDVAGRRR
jgi:SAM-dependent methyltransferase